MCKCNIENTTCNGSKPYCCSYCSAGGCSAFCSADNPDGHCAKGLHIVPLPGHGAQCEGNGRELSEGGGGFTAGFDFSLTSTESHTIEATQSWSETQPIEVPAMRYSAKLTPGAAASMQSRQRLERPARHALTCENLPACGRD